MYNTKTAVTTNTEFNSNYIPAGINSDITLKEVNVKKSPTGKDFLEIVFENESGQIATMTEWKNEKNQWIKTDEDLQKRDDVQFGRILQIVDCFYETRPEISLNSFAEMINWVKTILDPMIASKKKLRLKVIYDKNNYTKVSNYGIFVEPMTVEESQIKQFAKDSFERTIVADTETDTTDPLAGASAPSTQATETSAAPAATGADDLPF